MKALATTMISRLRIGYGWLTRAPLAAHHDRKHWVNLGYLLAGSLLVAAPLFYLGLFRVIATDHDLHVRLIQRGVDSGVWPVHFLFPAIVYALSGFSREIIPLTYSALIVLTTCVIAKGWLTYVLLARNGPSLPAASRENARGWSHETLLLVVTAALMVAAPVVRPWWLHRVYLGQISPNVWHNPTSIVCWPLVILLFFAADRFLRSGRLTTLAAVGILAAASVLAKPNYFLAFAPVFGLLGLWRFGLSRIWILSQLALVPTVMLLGWQLTASFDGPDAMRAGRYIAWMPLAAWRIYATWISVSLLFSFAFPLSYLIVFRRSLQNRELLLFAWGVMLCALLWTGCFAEIRASDGVVDGDFNFSWGSHLAIFVLFLVTVMDMLANPAAMSALGRDSAARWTSKLPWWLLGAHAVSGVFWIVRQVVGRGYN
jgi:hypothetical protein